MEKIKLLSAGYDYELEKEFELFLEKEKGSGEILEIIETELIFCNKYVLKVRYKKINILDMI